MANGKFRPTELELPKRLGITEEVHQILKKQRRIQEKSMARIVNDLILREYGELGRGAGIRATPQ